MLLHASINNSKDIVPSAQPGGAGIFGWNTSAVAWLTVVLLWICAGFLLARMRKMSLAVPRISTSNDTIPAI